MKEQLKNAELTASSTSTENEERRVAAVKKEYEDQISSLNEQISIIRVYRIVNGHTTIIYILYIVNHRLFPPKTIYRFQFRVHQLYAVYFQAKCCGGNTR